MKLKKFLPKMLAGVAVVASLAWGQCDNWTSSTIRNCDGYDYELWSQDNKGTFNMKITGGSSNPNGGTFEGAWSGTQNILFRAGKKWGSSSTTTAKAVGNISIDFAATWQSGDDVKMLGVYGWAYYPSGSVPSGFTNQIEFYIIQDRGSYNPASSANKAQKKGEGTIDGIAYEFWVGDRINQPNLTGNGNFKQYFSVPKSTGSHRQSGIISVSKHFDAWDKAGMKMMDCPLYEVAMKVESYSQSGSSGTAKVTKNILTLGGASSGGDEYSLVTNVTPTGGGTVTRNPNNNYYAANANVQLTATPATGWKFVGWTGDASGTNATTSVTMSKDRTVTAKFELVAGESTTNLIIDGNFPSASVISSEDGTSWKMGQGQYWGESAATTSVSNGVATINVTKVGAESYQPQLVQYSLPLDQDMQYKLTFKARAAAARAIEASFQQASDPWAGYASKEFQLTTTEQEYEFVFTMDKASDPGAQFAFNLGQATGNVYISDVKLVFSTGGTTALLDGKSSIQAPVQMQGKMLNINSHNAPVQVKVVGINGKVSANFNAISPTSFSLAHLPSGLYFLDIKSQGIRHQQQIVLP